MEKFIWQNQPGKIKLPELFNLMNAIGKIPNLS